MQSAALLQILLTYIAAFLFYRDAAGGEDSINEAVEHSDVMGSLAIALNRPTDNELGDVLERESLRRAFADAPLHLGGTSSIDDAGRSNVWMLASTRGRTREEHEDFVGGDGAEPVLPGLWLLAY